MTPDDETEISFDFKRYLLILWPQRGLLAIGAIVGMLIGVALAHVVPEQYKVSMIVRPPPTSSSLPGISKALSGLGALAGGAGSGFASADQSDFDEFKQLVDSNELSQTIALHHPEIMHVIYDKQWDDGSKQWVHEGVGATISDTVKAILGMTPWRAPDGETLKQYLAKNITQDNDLKTSMVTLEYFNKDPVFAQKLLSLVHSEADRIVRDKTRQRSAARIAYLERVIPTVTQTDEHEVLISLLATEEQRSMTVSADQYFVALPVDDPIVSKHPAWPPVPLMILVCTLLGFSATAGYLLLRSRKTTSDFGRVVGRGTAAAVG